MKPKILILFFALTTLGKLSASSQPEKKFEIVGDSIPASTNIFLAEVHGIYDLPEFKIAVTRLAIEKYHISNVVWEIGKAEAYLYNAYLQDGDTTLFTEYPDQRIHDYFRQLKNLYQEHHFTFHGIDFERLEFVTAVLSILNKTPEAHTTALYRYLSSTQDSAKNIDDDKAGSKNRIEIYTRAQAIFAAEKENLHTLLKTGFTTIEDIMENPTSEKAMSKGDRAMIKIRDAAMCQNLLQLKKLKDNRFICVLGVGHMTLHSKTDLLVRYIENTSAENITLLQMICKNCYLTSYFGSNILWPMVADYEGKKDNIFSGIYDQFYKPGYYSLINQKEIKALSGDYNKVPTYYILFKDQPKTNQ